MRLPDTPALQRASHDYQTQRMALYDEERAVLDHIERVAAQRRELPDGPAVEDAALTSLDGSSVQLSELFEDGDVLLAYNMMYAPDDDAPCPMCTRWVDGFNAVAPRVRDNVPFAIFSRASAEKLRALALSRSWSIPIYSAPKAFGRDIGAENAEGDQMPVVTVFRKDGSGAISLWYSQCAEMPDDEVRGIDLLNPLWHLLDLTPAGRGDYFPPEVVSAVPVT